MPVPDIKIAFRIFCQGFHTHILIPQTGDLTAAPFFHRVDHILIQYVKIRIGAVEGKHKGNLQIFGASHGAFFRDRPDIGDIFLKLQIQILIAPAVIKHQPLRLQLPGILLQRVQSLLDTFLRNITALIRIFIIYRIQLPDDIHKVFGIFLCQPRFRCFRRIIKSYRRLSCLKKPPAQKQNSAERQDRCRNDNRKDPFPSFPFPALFKLLSAVIRISSGCRAAEAAVLCIDCQPLSASSAVFFSPVTVLSSFLPFRKSCCLIEAVS